MFLTVDRDTLKEFQHALLQNSLYAKSFDHFVAFDAQNFLVFLLDLNVKDSCHSTLLLLVLSKLLVNFLDDKDLLGFLREFRFDECSFGAHNVAKHDHVFSLKRPACRVIIYHSVFHVLNYFLMNVLNFPLPRHALVDRHSGERMREPVKSVVLHIVIVDEFYHVSLFELTQKFHSREHLL